MNGWQINEPGLRFVNSSAPKLAGVTRISNSESTQIDYESNKKPDRR
jgi:hypothetical protein